MTTRRTLLKSSATAGLVAMAPQILKAQTSTDPIKVGLMGCGGRGIGALTQALSADPGVVLWSLGDLFQPAIDRTLKIT